MNHSVQRYRNASEAMIEIFSCTVDMDRDPALAYLEGELDMSTVGGLVEQLDPLAASGRHMVINLAGLSFLGTAGIKALAEVRQDAIAAGGSMHLTEVPFLVERVLAVTGMCDEFPITDPI